MNSNTPRKDEQDTFDVETFVEVLNNTFLVRLDIDDLESCRTLGDVERVVYDQVQAGMLGNRDILYKRLFERLNGWLESSKCSPLTPNDLDEPLDELSKRMAQRKWSNYYRTIAAFLESDAPPLRLTMASRIVLWPALAIMVGVLCWAWLSLDTAVAILATLFGAIAYGVGYFNAPVQRSRPVRTLREYFAETANAIEETQQQLSLPEVQYRIRSMYASWRDMPETSAPMTADTPLEF
jgi:hypothetical protein